MKKIFMLSLVISAALFFSGCTPTTGKVDNNQSLASGLYHNDFSALAQKLAAELAVGVTADKIGRIAVAGLGGPGACTTELGVHLGDKLGVAMFETGKFFLIFSRKVFYKFIRARGHNFE